MAADVPGSGRRPSSKPGARVRGRTSSSPANELRPGTLTELLQQIAAVPEDEAGAGWNGWLAQGQVVGRFELVREIGRGGFGVVWEARDQKLGRNVAFKAVRAGGKAALREERLLREAEAAARLSHPNLVTLHDVGRADQGPYLVLELLKGENLGQRLERGPITVREAVRIALEIAKGVAHAHAQGVVHRDLKPANVVLCEDGQVKVLDFGMAHAFGQRREDGGTPAYMAPEQWSGAPEDERTDVFALGVMLFEMTSGELPFPADEGGKEILSRARAPELEIPESPALADLVARMLEKDPTGRPRDGVEVLADLTEIHLALELVNVTPVAAVRKRRRSHWRLLSGVAAGVAVGTIAAVLFLRGEGGASLMHHDDRMLVAVADFANETHDPDLDGLSGLLITSLEQSKKLRVLTRGRMIDLVREMGHEGQPRIDESVARAAGQKAGVRTLLLASIQKLGDTYAAELRALDPKKDEYLFTLREQANAKDDLLPLIDRISERTRLALREPDAEVKASGLQVAAAVTPNLEAYRHYFRGKELAGRSLLWDALAEFKRAVEIEPAFTLAQLEIAYTAYVTSRISRAAARDLMREALRSGARPPEKEAALIRVLSNFFEGRFPATRAEIRSLASRFPEDPDVARLTAEVSLFSGDFEGSLPHFERALRLAPEWDWLRHDQLTALISLGKKEEALRIAEAAARQRRSPTAWAVAAAARYAMGDVEGGVRTLQTSGGDDVLSKALLAHGLSALGRIDAALEALAGFDSSTADVARAQVLAHAGRLREGLALMERAAQRPGVVSSYLRESMAAYLAATGDLRRAGEAARAGDFFIWIHAPVVAAIADEDHLAQFVAHFGPDPLFVSRFVRALAARRAGDRNSALSELRALDAGTVSFVPYFHGVLAAEAGQDDEAVQAFRRFERPAFWFSDAYEAPWLQARARFLMARSLERLGRGDEARKMLDLQLARWKGADPGLSLLAEMKALRGKLDVPPSAK